MEVREQKKRPRAPQRPREDSQIVYTQPKPFNRRRFFLRMITVLAVVLAVVFGMYVFFRVDTVNVSGQVDGVNVTGTQKYTPWQVLEASGISKGDHLLTINKARISGRIIARLPYVDEVRIGIKLPDVVNIEITELAVVYAVEAQDGSWWLMDAGGRLIEKTDKPADYTRVLGVVLESPKQGQQAKALEPETAVVTGAAEETGTDPTQTQPPVTEYAAEKLAKALQILQLLEENGILGKMATVDVSELLAVELWYQDLYQIQLGDSTDRLSYKVTAMAQALAQMGSYQSGTLDVSFTTWPNQVGYTPFE